MANEPNKHRSSVGHDGRSRAFAKPGEQTLLIHHDPNAPRVRDGMQERTSGNIARAGKPKAFHPVSVHKGMTAQQVAMAGVGGMGHGTAAPDASAANPLAPTTPGKVYKPAPASPGMRSRINNDNLAASMPGEHIARAAANAGNLNHELGRKILDEAFRASSADDRRAHGRE